MRTLTWTVRKTIVALGLAILAVVLFPDHIQPLWGWSKTTLSAIGHDPLPSFSTFQGFASLGLLSLVAGGMGYILWRDRRYEVLEAEYAHQTGVTQLREKVHDLESQLEKATATSEKWQQAYETLNKQHTAVLVVAKEHEVRSKYGQEDRLALADLRVKMEALLREKGHIEGMREALDLIALLPSQPAEPAENPLQATVTTSKGRQNGKQDRPALPFR